MITWTQKGVKLPHLATLDDQLTSYLVWRSGSGKHAFGQAMAIDVCDSQSITHWAVISPPVETPEAGVQPRQAV
jgi:hypothetical protein